MVSQLNRKRLVILSLLMGISGQTSGVMRKILSRQMSRVNLLLVRGARDWQHPYSSYLCTWSSNSSSNSFRALSATAFVAAMIKDSSACSEEADYGLGDDSQLDSFMLHEAVKDQDENRIRKVLETEKGREQLNQLQQDKKFDINKLAPLHLAVKTCNPDIVQLLLDQPGIDVAVGDDLAQETPLHKVKECPDFRKIVTLLLNAGADIAAKSKYGKTPLDKAHSFCYHHLVRYLIEQGASKAGGVELHEAVKAQELPHIKEILKAESGKMQLNKLQGDGDIDELAPLHLAVETGNIKIVRELLRHPEVDVNVRSKSQATPLHFARSTEMAALLLDAGADIEATDYLDYTPLDRATFLSSEWNLARYLVQRGASLGHGTYKNLNPDTYSLNSQEAYKMHKVYEKSTKFWRELLQIERDLHKS